MELVTFTRENCQRRAVGKASVRIEPRGTLSFSGRCRKDLGLAEGDKIIIHQDKSRPKDWYISKTDSEYGLTLRKQGPAQLIVNAKSIVRKIYESLGVAGGSKTFIMATEPVEGEYYAIITSSGGSA